MSDDRCCILECKCPNVTLLPYIRLETTVLVARFSTSQYITVNDQQPDVTCHNRDIRDRHTNYQKFVCRMQTEYLDV